MFADDLFRRRPVDFFDFHTTLGARHDQRLARGAVVSHAQVNLRFDLRRRIDQDLEHLVILDVHPQDRIGVILRFFRGFCQFDAASLATSPGEHLRLDHDRHADFLGDFVGLLGRECHLAFRHRNAKLRKT